MRQHYRVTVMWKCFYLLILGNEFYYKNMESKSECLPLKLSVLFYEPKLKLQLIVYILYLVTGQKQI